MGFRNGAYAKVWEVTSVSPTHTKLKMSVSRKNKQTDEYEDDFSGFVSCFGTAVASQAARLSNGARIKLGECDVSTSYNKEKKIGYTNFKLFSFEDAEFDSTTTTSSGGDPTPPTPVDDGEVDDSTGRLPF